MGDATADHIRFDSGHAGLLDTLLEAHPAVSRRVFRRCICGKAPGHWQTNLPRDVYVDLVSHAREAGRPGI